MKKIKIIALGDSITNGVRVDVSEEDTYRHLLQEGLSQKTEHDVTVINAGVNSDITWAHLLVGGGSDTTA